MNINTDGKRKNFERKFIEQQATKDFIKKDNKPAGKSKLKLKGPVDKRDFKPLKILGKDIHIKANVAGKLRSSKGINVPHVNITGSLITARDKKMLKFAEKNKVDFVGLSFIESGNHLKKIRNLVYIIKKYS